MIEAGLTGIVGPNGCGKSNLVEALRWVMGETSAKRLRGGEMDDVIFAGTSSRPARNVAEVTLHLDNTRHDAPQPYDEFEEIEIGRRIERGVGSDFRINGREARARDVQLLFADVATGAQSSGDGQPGPRRRHHHGASRRSAAACWRKRPASPGCIRAATRPSCASKAAETNLARLDDVLQTLETQLEGLKKQARQAARYRRLSRPYPPRRGGGAASALVRRPRPSLTAAEERLRAAERAVADRTDAALGGRAGPRGGLGRAAGACARPRPRPRRSCSG